MADTYNNRIKLVDPITRASTAFAGTGIAGEADGAADESTFWEPGGVSVGGGKLYVADTNNHRIRVVDLATRQVLTLKLRGAAAE